MLAPGCPSRIKTRSGRGIVLAGPLIERSCAIGYQDGEPAANGSTSLWSVWHRREPVIEGRVREREWVRLRGAGRSLPQTHFRRSPKSAASKQVCRASNHGWMETSNRDLQRKTLLALRGSKGSTTGDQP